MREKEDPRVTRTRQLLQDAFIQLMSEKEYEKITISNITKEATVNRATFYLHYQDKEELLLQTVDEMLHQLFGEALTIPPGNLPIDELQRYIAVHIFSSISEYDKFFHVMLIKKGMPNFLDQMRDFFFDFYDNRIAKGRFDPLPLPSEVIASYIASAYTGMISWWLENDMPYTPEEMAEQMIQLNQKGPTGILKMHVRKQNER
ncbi:TetR/AcrR family transcriptional regulator [Guptibacillus hwajinpoensis]|uniref:TetR/AcrR family transcriptional regulator n=1 Tax=Guptibacillus hwajinpoensis TaxID=208199 RepID=UPI00384E604C